MGSVVVKRAYGRWVAEMFPANAMIEQIRDGVKEAVAKLASFHPYKVKGTPTVEITLSSGVNADGLAMLPMPGMERLRARTFRFTAKSVIDVLRFCFFIARYNSGKPDAPSP
jgi:D-aminopeptidase